MADPTVPPIPQALVPPPAMLHWLEVVIAFVIVATGCTIAVVAQIQGKDPAVVIGALAAPLVSHLGLMRSVTQRVAS